MPEIDKSGAAVSSMFSRIAGRYDLLNHLLSGNADRRWRRIAAAALNGRHRRVLDLATGTGDLALSIGRNGREVVGADFCLDMLALARRKTSRSRNGCRISFSGADALALPFPDGSFDAVTVAFGVRNFADLPRGLGEIGRILKSGGKLVVLEFSRPRGAWGAVFRFYSGRLLPWIGGVFSGSQQAYSYLNRSTLAWPEKEELSRILEACGFADVRARSFTLGIVALHEAVKR